MLSKTDEERLAHEARIESERLERTRLQGARNEGKQEGRQEGLEEGLEKGEKIAKIWMMYRALNRPEPSWQEFKALPLEELSRILDALTAEVQKK